MKEEKTSLKPSSPPNQNYNKISRPPFSSPTKKLKNGDKIYNQPPSNRHHEPKSDKK